MDPYGTPLDHLLDHIALLELRLARHVAALRATGRFVEDPFRGLYVADREIDAILANRQDAAAGSALDGMIALRAARLAERAAVTTIDLPLLQLQRRFDLTPLDIAALVAAAACAFDARFEILFAYAQNDATRRQPTVGLMLDLFAGAPNDRRDGLLRFTPGAPLRAFRLISPLAGAAEALSLPLCLDPHMLAVLLGDTTDPLEGALKLLPEAPLTGQVFAETQRALNQQLAQLQDAPVVALLQGPSDVGQLQVATAEAASRSMCIAVLDLTHPAAGAGDDDGFAATVGRALRLNDAALFVEIGDTMGRARLARLIARAVRPGRPVFLSGAAVTADVVVLPHGAMLAEIPFAPLSEPIRRAWWQSALAAEGVNAPATAALMARTTRLGPSAVTASIGRARRLSATWPPTDHAPLVAAARRQAGPTLTRLAQPVETRWTWDELVLPADQREELRVLAAAVLHGPRIAADWGFHTRGPTSALVALFSGPSGTGKTMAAGLIAARAGVPLLRADLSAIVSKYIGDTEKQLDCVLREAEAIGAALLFDEADALFGKRAEVKDARDRYANQEVAFLLQRIESFDGLVILTTNLSGNIDQAFLRRIAYAVHFPMPDATRRAELWRQAFPCDAPLDGDLDLQQLANAFEISGGSIRNIALCAAHLAAAEDRPIAMRDVVRAVAREVRKHGRLPSRAEFGSLYAALAPPARQS